MVFQKAGIGLRHLSMGGPVHSPQKEQISPTYPFLDRKTLETPYSSPPPHSAHL